MRDKPPACFASGCPLAVTCQCGHHVSLHPEDSNCSFVDEKTSLPCKCNVFKSKGKGFVLGSGNPAAAKYMFMLETPGKDEIQFRVMPVKGRSFLETQPEVDAEILRRQRAFPELEPRFVKLGVPIVGASGVELEMWGFPKAGMNRTEVFADHTIRCLPPKGKMGMYPTGEERKEAEKCCRQWDRFEEFKPDVAIVTLHPAGILREVTPLPLQILDLQRARDFASAGLRPLLLLGGKAAHAFLRYAENVTKWRGHYEMLAPDWLTTYLDRFTFKAKTKAKPGPRVGAKAEKKKRETFAKLDHLFEFSDKVIPVKRSRRRFNAE